MQKKSKKRSPRSAPRPHSRWARRRETSAKPTFSWMRFLWGAFLLAFIALLLVGGGVFLVYHQLANQYDLRYLGAMPQRSVVYDWKGRVVGRLHGENRILISLDAVAPVFIDALLAQEDTRYLEHRGVDLRGIGRAMAVNLRRGRFVQGGSTITQQLARNSYPLGGRTLHRKILEAVLALRIEREYSKPEILQYYVNRIYYGSGLYGLERAAQAYFGKSASELNLPEAATLAGIIRSPNALSPFRNVPGARRARDRVIERMLELQLISEGEAWEAKEADLVVAGRKKTTFQENYALNAVRRDLELILSQDQIDEGGLKIYTSLDVEVQVAAKGALEKHLQELEQTPGYSHLTRAEHDVLKGGGGASAPDYVQGAVLVINNSTGGIVCLVGGRSFQDSKFNRALYARRQVGSLFKPIVYAAAFLQGMLPGMAVSDDPIRQGEIEGVTTLWSPSNSDEKYLGMQSAEFGLVRSRNTMSVRVGNFAGLEAVSQLARLMGLSLESAPTPSIFLGSLECTLREMTSAYSVFPNGGRRQQTYLIERIDNIFNEPIYRAAHIEQQVMHPGASWVTHQVLEKVMLPGGTAGGCRSMGFVGPAAGKTGTTNDYRDAWFVGYTAPLTCGVWVGFDRPRRIVSRGYGSRLALPIWVDTMQNAAQIDPYFSADDFESSLSIQEVELCSQSNLLATKQCEVAGCKYALTLPYEMVPKGFCSLHQKYLGREKKEGFWSRFRKKWTRGDEDLEEVGPVP